MHMTSPDFLLVTFSALRMSLCEPPEKTPRSASDSPRHDSRRLWAYC